MNKFVTWLGRVLVILAVVYFGKYLIDNADVFNNIRFDSSSIFGLIFSIVLYSFVIVLSAVAWKIILSGMGEKAGFWVIAKIFFISQFAKYIPGNIAHHVGRIALASKEKISTINVLISVLLETGWVISAGLIFLAFFVIENSLYVENIKYIPTDYTIYIILGSALLFPFVVKTLFKKIAPLILKDKFREEIIILPNAYRLFYVFVINIIIFIILGVVVEIISENIFLTETNNILITISAFAIAWVIGYITPGAPAGVGVREAVLVALLTPVYGADVSVGTAATLRIVSVIGDSLIFLAGIVISRRTHSIKSIS